MDEGQIEELAVMTAPPEAPTAEREGRGGDDREPPNVHVERMKLQYAAWMDEYKALRAEITALGTSSRQGTQVAIVALAALISLAGYIVQNDLPILFLLAPFIFYALAWTQLRLIYTAQSISNYILKNTTDGVAWALGQLTPCDYPPAERTLDNYSASPRRPLEWDEVARREMNSYKKRLWLIEASAFVIPVTIAMLVPGGYLWYVNHYHVPISRYATAYILLNETVWIYTVMMGTWMRRFRQGQHDHNSPNPNRYCDLVFFQFGHWIANNFMAVFRGKGLVGGRLPPAPWYEEQVPRRLMSGYRAARWLLWFAVALETVHLISAYNSRQWHWVQDHQVVLTLTNGQAVHGVLLGYEGRDYVLTVASDKQQVDASLVKAVKRLPPAGAMGPGASSP